MDPKNLLDSLRALNPLNMVVSTEPLEVVAALNGPLGAARGTIRFTAMTRFGLMPAEAYSKGGSLRWDVQTEGKSGERIARPVMGAVEQIGAAHAEDAADGQYIYAAPDLWPDLADHHVIAALQRFYNSRSVDSYSCKMMIIITPTLDLVPTYLRHMFDIHVDGGLTEEETVKKLASSIAMLRPARDGGKPDLDNPEVTALAKELAPLARGFSSAEIDRMISASVVHARRVQGIIPSKPTVEGCRMWLSQHGRKLGSG